MEEATNKKSRIATTIAAVGLAAAMLIGGGTFAYLHGASVSLANIFNSNKVTVSLTEPSGQSYEVIPGTSQKKDPTVTVNATVPAYVFVDVSDELYNDGNSLGEWAVATGWTVLKGTKDDAFVLYRTVQGNDNPQDFHVIKDDTVSYSASLENEDMNWTTKALTFQAYAIQQNSFDSAEAAWEEIKGTATVTDTEPVVADGTTNLAASIGGETIATASVPSDAVATGTENLILTVTPQEAGTQSQQANGLKVEIDDPTRGTVNYNVTISGVKDENTTAIYVTIYVGKNLNNVKVYHSGTVINEATYDSDNGTVTFTTTSFSDYTIAYDLDNWSNHKATEFSVVDNDAKTLTINSAGELALFAANASSYAGYTVTLGADIDLAGYVWTPIVPAYNQALTFDGDNHTISNLFIKSKNGDVGLFADATGLTIKNVNIDNANVNGKERVGAICGQMISGSIDNCHVNNAIITATPYKGTTGNAKDLTTSYYGGGKAGGIIGRQSYENTTPVTNCSVSNVTISGYRDVGGIAGMASGTTPALTNCTVTNATIKLVSVPKEDYETDDGNADSTNIGVFYGRKDGTPNLDGSTYNNVKLYKDEEEQTIE